MRNRIVSLFLSAALLGALLMSMPAQVNAVELTDSDIIRAVLVVLGNNEGTYNSVTCNDNGAVSIGRIGWHGVRALELLKSISAADPETARALLGDSLYQEVVEAATNAWNNRILTRDEGARVQALLGTEPSAPIQDALGQKDAAAYLSYAKAQDIHTSAALVYYCDLQNQYGPTGAANILKKIKALLGKTTVDSLDELHNSLVQVTSNYLNRRNWTYSYCSALSMNGVSSVGGTAVLTIPKDLDLQPPVIQRAAIVCVDAKTFRVDAEASDNIRVIDCRAEVHSDVTGDQTWVGYAAVQSGNRWSLSVPVGGFSAKAERFTVTFTARDASGNGASKTLTVTRGKLQFGSVCLQQGHQYALVSETAASCFSMGLRVEQCSVCEKLRQTRLAPVSPLLLTACPPVTVQGGRLVYRFLDFGSAGQSA